MFWGLSRPRRLRAGLSARLLLLTVAFVMLAEVLIYAPSIARFRLTYLEERLAAAHLAILALDATPDQMVSAALGRELLAHVGAHSVALKRAERGKLMLMAHRPPRLDATYDLRGEGFFGLIGDAAVSLTASSNRILRVVGLSPKDPNVEVEVVLDEAPLRAAMFGYSKRILGLSLVISLITAALVYLSLHWLLVLPMRRITASITAFRDNPEDASRIIQPSQRSDEIGMVQSELATMQDGLRAALHQKTRLAGLGIAVTKINHDLKNILATALLVSDRLLASEDPEVRRLTPTLMRAIERAVKLCAQTLAFTREGPPPLELTRFDLRALIDDVAGELPETTIGDAAWRNGLDEAIEVRADREQLFRVLANLGKNAFEAGAKAVELSAKVENNQVLISVADDGPGLSPRAQERLFQPFAGSARSGGTGLGLAIARDLMHAHGGDIRLERTTGEGTCFCLVLPLIAEGERRLHQLSLPSAGPRADAA